MYLFHLHAVTPHYSVSRQLPSVKKVGLELFPQKQPETPHQHLIILNDRSTCTLTTITPPLGHICLVAFSCVSQSDLFASIAPSISL